jgi:Glycosyl hydrolase family 63 C-terminal domain
MSSFDMEQMMANTPTIAPVKTAEARRLDEARERGVPWRQWGPYLSERQWGTVREDYSSDGNAWDYFSHDQARSRAYHWGEDGIAGISDDYQRLCIALALWNGKDPILKERMFGLTNSEGNHGEDVKEYYYYLDSTPTHSYMKYLYKYPQSAYRYMDLISTNRRRNRTDPEYELIDTGIFDEDRYFDVYVEYAKATPNDLLIEIRVINRGPDESVIDVLPTLWFRNTWTWWPEETKPSLKDVSKNNDTPVIAATDSLLGTYFLHFEEAPRLLFTENETNKQRLFGTANPAPYVKDGINDYIVAGRHDAVNPGNTGTKAAAHYRLRVGAGATEVIRLRLTQGVPGEKEQFGSEFTQFVQARRREADEFYQSITPPGAGEDAANVMRQALAGMLWSKQYFFYDVDEWLEEHRADPLLAETGCARNREWFHMISEHVISMPDKWEYPWFAAWDLAFHTIAFAAVDIDFAKDQLDLLLVGAYQHPSGQIPAYEWNFSDVNPPVHAWATIFLYRTEQALRGKTDIEFLRRVFSKLTWNFGWWANRKDRFGNNLYEGGFLGLDNIGVFDRSAPLPTGGYLEQADGTAWMAFYSQTMLEIAVELAAHDRAYEDVAANFVVHFVLIARSMNRIGGGMWDEEDGFYYDVLRLPDGATTRLNLRSMVGLLPLCAVTVIEKWQRERVSKLAEHLSARLRRMPELVGSIHASGNRGVAGRGILALVNEDRLRRILSTMLNENEFLSPYGIRALSRYHADHPYVFSVHGQEHRVNYLPAESDTGMFGGNSNWRGPIWMPVNILVVRALLQYYLYLGDTFTIECPTGSGNLLNLFEVAREIANRLIRIFLRDQTGRRPVFGGAEKFQTDPYWRDHLLFYEYFHGDNGAGIGASHQTGWTGLVAILIEIFGRLDGETYLREGRAAFDLE